MINYNITNQSTSQIFTSADSSVVDANELIYMSTLSLPTPRISGIHSSTFSST